MNRYRFKDGNEYIGVKVTTNTMDLIDVLLRGDQVSVITRVEGDGKIHSRVFVDTDCGLVGGVETGYWMFRQVWPGRTGKGRLFCLSEEVFLQRVVGIARPTEGVTDEDE